MRGAATVTAWIAALLLVAGTFAVSRAQAQERKGSADDGITQRVQRALAEDPFLGSMEIYIETQDRVVNLSGFVRSEDDIAKAGELARAVSGVSAVRNGLRVGNRRRHEGT
jgi:osmotically-inducible protein OsmY